jgi:transposase
MIERKAIDGPCGYGLQRQIEGIGHPCEVVAPSLIPTRPSDRVKTDRRDALSLAKLHRASELTPVWVPNAAHSNSRPDPRRSDHPLRAILSITAHLTSGRPDELALVENLQRENLSPLDEAEALAGLKR